MDTPLLILNGTEGRLEVILCRHDMVEASYTVMASSQGAERLTPLLSDAFKQHGIAPNSLSRIACVTGPGSFTGLRLILATASALRRTSVHKGGALLYGINYLQAIATSLSALPEETNVRVLTHARRGLVYTQDFITTQHSANPLNELDILSIDDALCLPCKQKSAPDVLLGSGILRNQECIQAYFTSHNPHTRILPAYCAYPNADALCILCPPYDDPAWQACDLEPMYMRPCDAEENLAHIASKDGRSPEQAQQALAQLLHTTPRGCF